uniref:Uncharacterized protein n=1 Tax=Romanomermis culicivorax TaxID=13658 RepID=A0A915K8N4_ROMCU
MMINVVCGDWIHNIIMVGDDWLQSAKPRMNGSSIGDLNRGKYVTVLGKVAPNSQDRSNRSITLITCGDNVKLLVRFDQPVADLSGYVEIQGRILSKNEIECLNVVCFSEEMVQRFDADAYSKAVASYQKQCAT